MTRGGQRFTRFEEFRENSRILFYFLNVDFYFQVTAIIKERLVKQGSVLIGYVPRPHKKIGNFFRMVVTCHPRPTHSSMKFVIDEIERVGEML